MSRIRPIEIVAPETRQGVEATRALENRLMSYRVPKEIARKKGIRRIEEVTEPWLIVVCTPDTPNDPVVRRRIEQYIEQGRYLRILTLLATGTPDTSFPERLLYEERPDGSVIEREPLAANITAESGQSDFRKLEVEKLRLLAPILGVTFDDLMNRRRRAAIRRLMVVGFAVIASALIFLGYSFYRIQIMENQNLELKNQYALMEIAGKEAAEQRDTARLSYARTVAMEAQSELDKGNTERALELCLEQREMAQQVPELLTVLDDALHTLCAGGYVPVADQEKYLLMHFTEETAQEETPLFPEKLEDIPVPADINAKYTEQNFWLETVMPEYGYAVYSADIFLKEKSPSGADKQSCTYIYFPSDPQRNHFQKDPEGKHLYTRYAASKICPLPDGRFAMLSNHRLFTVDPVTGGSVWADEDEYESLLYIEGCDVFFLRRENSIEVLDRATLEHLETLEGVTELKESNGAGILIGKAGKALAIYDQKPFGFQCMIDDEEIRKHLYGNMKFNSVTVNGRTRYLAIFDCIYNADTGELVCDLSDLRNGLAGSHYTPVLSSDGLAFVPAAGPAVRIWELEGNKYLGRVPLPTEGHPISESIFITMMGTLDENTGFRSASAFSINGIVFELRESRDVPEDSEAQFQLAETLLRDV